MLEETAATLNCSLSDTNKREQRQAATSSDQQHMTLTLTLTHNGTVCRVCIVDREEKDYTKWALEYLKEALVAE